jgi:hypothetical protein
MPFFTVGKRKEHLGVSFKQIMQARENYTLLLEAETRAKDVRRVK